MLFPRKCLGCGKEGAYFCAGCLNLVSELNEDICPVCERPSIGGWTHHSCQKTLNLDGLTSVFAYKGLVKKAIVQLKYRFVFDLASDLVELFLSFSGERDGFRQVCRKNDLCLVPVPLHPRRKRWRGFNQSELLGKIIAKNLGIGFAPDILIRVKNTTPQMQLGEKERRVNIQGAFRLSPNILVSQYPNVLLFDDVWTTGATLKETAKILKQGGVTTVWGLTLAR